MKVGELGRWSPIETAYHHACLAPGIIDLTPHRKCGIIIDTNGMRFFVHWLNGDFIAQKPNTIEVINEGR